MDRRDNMGNGEVLAVPEEHAHRMLRYGAAGAMGTAAHYVLLFLLLGALGAVVASTIGAAIGALVNFLLARHWVFADRRELRFALPKFAVVAAVSLGVNAAILSLMILSLPVFSAQLVATGCAFLTGYVLNDAWTFYERAR